MLPRTLARPAVLLALTLTGAVACSSSAGSTAPAAAAVPPDGPSEADAAAPAVDAGRDATLPANGSKGCGLAAAKSGALDGLTVDVGGTSRTYAMSVPPKYDPYRAYKLVFNFHSGGRTGAGARDYFGFEAFAADDAIFVYPDGVKGNWDLDDKADANPDVAFFDALLADVEAKLCVDGARVFATGSSMGAYFANQLGCRRGDVLRAIAPHAGGGPYEIDGDYDSDGHLHCAGKPVAAMIFIGLADTNVDPSEGQKSIDHWTWANGCKADTKPVDPSPCVAYDGCQRPVNVCKVPGVGHKIWDQGPKATWDFFASF